MQIIIKKSMKIIYTIICLHVLILTASSSLIYQIRPEDFITGSTGATSFTGATGVTGSAATGPISYNLNAKDMINTKDTLYPSYKNLRGRIMIVSEVSPSSDGNCPGSCMLFDNTTKKCNVKKCYGWDNNLGKCYHTGKSQTTALILQGIPFTGVFGSGFGNIGRWDLFAIPMSIIFGGCSLGIITMCCCLGCCNGDENGMNDKDAILNCYSSCFTCIYAITILALYIWGIVIIANKSILDGNGCELV
tara:strand:+ start:2849 stop:3592 length:744 start_codon:yes stop_codon:yes gene_type:complete